MRRPVTTDARLRAVYMCGQDRIYGGFAVGSTNAVEAVTRLQLIVPPQHYSEGAGGCLEWMYTPPN